MNLIKVGDKVNISWEHMSYLPNVEIVAIPTSPEDSWVVKDELGNVSLINNFCRMDKLPIVPSEILVPDIREYIPERMDYRSS
ncbi:MAG: hypothetical protein M0R03_20340 [Novosphingobium sp.]|nr:hypothetical protein [Novosphingobium sp.]